MRFPAQLLNACCPSSSESELCQFTSILQSQWSVSGTSRSPQELVSPDLQPTLCLMGESCSSPLLPYVPCSKQRLLQPGQEVSKPCKLPPKSGVAIQGMTAFLLQNTVCQTKGFSEKMKQWNYMSASVAEFLSSAQTLPKGFSTL